MNSMNMLEQRVYSTKLSFIPVGEAVPFDAIKVKNYTSESLHYTMIKNNIVVGCGSLRLKTYPYLQRTIKFLGEYKRKLNAKNV